MGVPNHSRIRRYLQTGLADRVDREGFERSDERIEFRQEELGEDEARDHAVKEEIAP
jgi:hypothetical protein